MKGEFYPPLLFANEGARSHNENACVTIPGIGCGQFAGKFRPEFPIEFQKVNDFWIGSRATDDGVKAAATNTMTIMTSFPGSYNTRSYKYHPPGDYRNWYDVVRMNGLKIHAANSISILP